MNKAITLSRAEMKKVMGGFEAEFAGSGRCVDVGICYYDGMSGTCREMSSGQCRCVILDSNEEPVSSIPFSGCLKD